MNMENRRINAAFLINFDKPEAYWLRAIKNPQGKSRGRYVSLSISRLNIHSPRHERGFFIAPVNIDSNGLGDSSIAWKTQSLGEKIVISWRL